VNISGWCRIWFRSFVRFKIDALGNRLGMRSDSDGSCPCGTCIKLLACGLPLSSAVSLGLPGRTLTRFLEAVPPVRGTASLEVAGPNGEASLTALGSGKPPSATLPGTDLTIAKGFL
jgi:hypothetical protein